jgi:LmbE family N-acetylglucosaminyl deacetylase
VSASATRDRPLGERFLAALADPARPPLPFRAAVVVAHPDDETIGCGAQLQRFSDLSVIHVTDGSPENGADAAALGFAGPDDYRAARRRELEAAMAVAGVAPERLIALGWPDQEASFHLAEIATDLAERLAGTEVVLTHAYEGGHPDHDSVAFAAHAACALMIARGEPPAIIEMPLYRLGEADWAVQLFIPEPDAPETIVYLGPDECRLKGAMFAAFVSQGHVLPRFSLDKEPFRLAPRYDFWRLPNNGALLYERLEWGMTGARWLELAGAALAELRSGAAA